MSTNQSAPKEGKIIELIPLNNTVVYESSFKSTVSDKFKFNKTNLMTLPLYNKDIAEKLSMSIIFQDRKPNGPKIIPLFGYPITIKEFAIVQNKEQKKKSHLEGYYFSLNDLQSSFNISEDLVKHWKTNKNNANDVLVDGNWIHQSLVTNLLITCVPRFAQYVNNCVLLNGLNKSQGSKEDDIYTKFSSGFNQIACADKVKIMYTPKQQEQKEQEDKVQCLRIKIPLVYDDLSETQESKDSVNTSKKIEISISNKKSEDYIEKEVPLYELKEVNGNNERFKVKDEKGKGKSVKKRVFKIISIDLGTETKYTKSDLKNTCAKYDMFEIPSSEDSIRKPITFVDLKSYKSFNKELDAFKEELEKQRAERVKKEDTQKKENLKKKEDKKQLPPAKTMYRILPTTVDVDDEDDGENGENGETNVPKQFDELE